MTEKAYWEQHMRSLKKDDPFLILAHNGKTYTYGTFFCGVEEIAKQIRATKNSQMIVCMEN